MKLLHSYRVLLIAAAILVALQGSSFAAEDTRKQLEASAAALAEGKLQDALPPVEQVLAQEPDNVPALALRSRVRTARKEYAEALADLERAVRIAPEQVTLYDLRGDARFFAGDFAGALADFDEYLTRRPQAGPPHWRRGIVCYYADKFPKGRDQFAAYQTVDDADVENAVWHYLCNAKVVGREQARAEIPKVRPDRRVPLMTVLELFHGRATLDDVDRACEGPDLPAEEQASRRFFANLYAGLYLASEGKDKEALARLEAASDPALADPRKGGGGYMWEVARVHAAKLKRELAADKAR